MKKALIVATIVAGAYGASAQGLVSFNNSSSATTKISVNSTVGGAATGLASATANGYYYALFESVTATTVSGSSASVLPTLASAGTYAFSDSAWTYVSTVGSAATAGRLNGNPSQVINGVGGGSTAQFVVIGWSANIGSTLASLQTFLAAPSLIGGSYGFAGESAVTGALKLGDGALITAPAIFGLAPSTPGFVLGQVNPVPEPSSIALAALGGLSLLGLRRKKA